MKITLVLHKLYEVMMGADKVKAYRFLQQQRQLLYSGIEVSAEVMDISLMQKAIGKMRLVKLCIKLKKTDGSYVYIPTKALVSLNNIPQKGQSLRIRYFPDDLTSVMLM